MLTQQNYIYSDHIGSKFCSLTHQVYIHYVAHGDSCVIVLSWHYRSKLIVIISRMVMTLSIVQCANSISIMGKHSAAIIWSDLCSVLHIYMYSPSSQGYWYLCDSAFCTGISGMVIMQACTTTAVGFRIGYALNFHVFVHAEPT